MVPVQVEEKDQPTPLRIIAHRVRARRLELGWSRAALSVEAGVGAQAVDRVEQGQDVRLSSLLAISAALGLALEVR